jgi:hypothetical protein
LVGKEVREVSGGKVVESFVGQKEDLVFVACGDREPVEFTEEGGDVLPELSMDEDSGCRILNHLEFMEGT